MGSATPHSFSRAPIGVLFFLGLGACGLFAASDDELAGGSKPDAGSAGSAGENTGGGGSLDGSTDSPMDSPTDSLADSDAPQDAVADVPSDTVAETDAEESPGSFGHACSDDEPCGAGLLCLEPSTGAQARCSLLCCVSADCPADAVCATTTVGATGCFPVSSLNRPAPGDGPSGSPCVNGASDCRSAQCLSGVCRDVCCTHGSCTNDKACAFDEINEGWFCSPHAVGTGSGQGTICTADLDCDGRNCFDPGVLGDSKCMETCCRDSDCGANGFCDYFLDGTALIRQCLPSLVALQPLGPLKACCTDVDCPSGRCEVLDQKVWTKGFWGPVKGPSVLGLRCVP